MLKIEKNQEGNFIPHFKGPKVQKYPVIFFESYSYLKFFFLIKEIFSAGTVLFMRHELRYFMSRQTLKKNILYFLIKIVNPRAEVREISMAEMFPAKYYLNRRAAEVANALGENIRLSKAYRLLADIVRHEKVLDFYKGCLAIEFGNSLIFSNLAEYIVRSGNLVILVPDSLEKLKEGVSDKVYENLIECVTKLSKISIAATRNIEIMFWILRVLFYLPYLLINHLRNGFSPIVKKKFKVAIPVIWGVYSDADKKCRGHNKRFIDDTFLYGRYFSPGEILHVFKKDWMKSANPASIKAWKQAMQEKEISFVEENGHQVTGGIFKLTMLMMGKIIKGLFRSSFSCPFNQEVWKATAKGVKHFLASHYEMENTDCQVELVRNDYNPGHVISTIVANRYGRIRVGISHAASPYDAPQMCFIYLDKYVVSSELYTRLFSPFWNNLSLEYIEREAIDSIRQESQRSADNRKKVADLYAPKKWNVLILLPGVGEVCLVEQWDKIYQALVEFNMVDIDCALFLRFKNIDQARQPPHTNRFFELPSRDQRIIIDHENFNTHELMAASDLVIACNASFAINESLFARIPVFTFSYTLKEHLYFPDYGSQFILQESQDVLRSIRGLETGFEKFDCDWNRLRKDIEYIRDGKNTLRLDEFLYRMEPNIQSSKEIHNLEPLA